MKYNDLPRQARDKHEKELGKKRFYRAQYRTVAATTLGRARSGSLAARPEARLPSQRSWTRSALPSARSSCGHRQGTQTRWVGVR